MGEHVVTWLLRCWDNGASSLELEGREAKQLGSLSREGGIDKAIGKGPQALSLWRRLLSGVKERYPFKEDVLRHPGKWTTTERGIQYPRELAVLEVIYSDLDNKQLSKDPDEVWCTQRVWRKFVRSAPSSHANSLAVMTWKDGEEPTVDELVSQLRQYQEIPKIPLPPYRPVSWLWKICPGRSSNLKRLCPTPYLYEPVSQPLGDQRGPASSQVEERDNWLYWAVWIRWPGTSDPRECEALVDTGAQCPLMPSSNITPAESLIPIHELFCQLESPGVISKTRSPFNSPVWPVRKSHGEWRLTVDYRGLNEVMPPLSAAVPDMLELQYELESKAAKWYATNDIANVFFSMPLAAECRPQFAFTWRGVQYTWNRLPQGWKRSPTICHGLIQTALEQGEAQNICNTLMTSSRNPSHPGILEVITDWQEWSPVQQVAETAEGEGESNQFAEVKAIQLALDIAEREKWPVLHPYTDSWMVANALWGWLQQWKQSNWQRRGKSIWAAELWQDIAAQVENLVVKVHHVDAHIPKSWATEEHQNNQQVNQGVQIEVAQVDLDWQHKGKLFIARWAHDASGH
ncbi:hypothetical protein QYF61_020871 [Mycteria americana]|uniref:RNase H type-1 domain-containing protein n=1 Tax=Mycteria americana TaxID=33587 RepID=A0AAN7ND32_MYCAM|nr:hypothetical protein QYF61_020871 [Mycteria americana]